MTGNFCKVAYSDCEDEQVVFGKASSVINCAVRGTTLTTPTGGNAGFYSEVVEAVERRDNGKLEA